METTHILTDTNATQARKPMRQTALSIGMFILAMAGYHLLFWNESYGVNIFIFNLFVTAWLLYTQHKAFNQRNTLISALITLLFSVLTVINGSDLAKFNYNLSLIVFVGFVFHPNIKSILNAFPTGFLNFIFAFWSNCKLVVLSLMTFDKFPSFRRNFKFVLLPSVALFLFFLIFKFANPVFDDFTKGFINYIAQLIDNFFDLLSPIWLFFILFGAIVVSGVSSNGRVSLFAKYDATCSDIIERKHTQSYFDFSIKTIGLKDELKTGIILILAVNILLIIENIIDINWIWINFELSETKTYAQLVHEGTYLLILSILLSMGILFYYFRNNQNFYSKNKWLKRGAYLWITQNIVLVISVIIRNLRYIEQYGLTYRRIGVLVFLALTCFGLITLCIKVKTKKSFFYMLRTNTFALYLFMSLFTCFNWDSIIINYNLNMQQSAHIDKEYLLSFSDNTLPIIDQHKEYFREKQSVAITDTIQTRMSNYDRIGQRIGCYKADIKSSTESILSWNYQKYLAEKYFGGK